MTYAECIERARREYWQALLARGGKREDMAREAGVHRSHLYREAHRLGISIGPRFAPRVMNLGNDAWQSLGR